MLNRGRWRWISEYSSINAATSRVGHDPLDGFGRIDHRPGPLGQVAGEVVGESLAQRQCLAGIDDPALGVLEHVGPGGVGNFG